MSIFKHKFLLSASMSGLGLKHFKSIVFFSLCQILLLVSFSNPGFAAECLDIADAPLETPVSVTSVNVMFVLDDSGSMDWEFLVETVANTDGLFDVGGTPKYYLFDEVKEIDDYQDDPDDSLNLYPLQSYGNNYLEGDDRALWKSQWSGHNQLYYNPTIEYTPWYIPDNSLVDADPDNPRFHPYRATPTVSMSAEFCSLDTKVLGDDDDGGIYDENNGDWYNWSVDTAYNGNDRVTTTNGDWAEWEFTAPPVAGNNDVYVYVPPILNTSASYNGLDRLVTYTITEKITLRGTHANMNQTNMPGWTKLGTYNFNGTDKIIIKVEKVGGDYGHADAVKIVETGSTELPLPMAHYYTWSTIESKPYLVTLDGDIKYYEYNDDGDDKAESDEFTLTALPPADVTVGNTAADYTRERQNFANWFSYYRKRWYAALNAIGKAMPDMVGMKVGYRSINSTDSHPRLVQPVIKLDGTGIPSQALLTQIYGFPLDLDSASTPLRTGLEMVGLYYDVDNVTGGLEDVLLTSPLASDPYASCTQNYAILMTDGAWNGGAPLTAGADKNAGAPFADNQSGMLADVAYEYYNRDLAPDIDNNVPTNFIDNNSRQHMVTYAVTFGAKGRINPDDYPDEDLYNINVDDRVTPPWPTPSLDFQDKIDDLYHATVNSRGKYYNSTDPQQLENALKAIVSHIGSAEGSGASVSINGEELFPKSGARPHMFQAGFVSDGWAGDVMAYEIAETGLVRKGTDEELWFASEVMDDAQNNDSDYWNTGRVIVTSNGTNGARFRYANLTQDQKDALGATEAETKAILNYIRGDHSLEEREAGGIYRNRVVKKWDNISEAMVISREPTILGDIVHSAPFFYDYGSTLADDRGVLFVGGNDGMLHAFAAKDGTEIFGYVPNYAYTNLKTLADPDYEHRYFVDLTPFAMDIGTAAVPKTLLVGGLGKGGKGYYCLDITELDTIIGAASNTDAENSMAAKFKWEYPSTPGADDDLGYTFSQAFIVNSNAGWIVIFGNGYNSVNGNAVFYILDPETGNVLKKIDTEVGVCNGLSIPIPIDVNNDGKVDYAYAGDLKGNLWKFDLTATGAAGDTPAVIADLWDSAFIDPVTSKPAPLFQAKDSLGNPQPITSKPDVMRHSDKEGYLVLFGTGKYLGETDVADAKTQTIYGIWDYGDDSDDDEYLGSFNRAAANPLSNFAAAQYVTLLEQTEIYHGTSGDNYLRVLSDNVPNWGTVDDLDPFEEPNPKGLVGAPAHAGWFFDLPLTKERVVKQVEIRSGVGIVISYNFESGGVADPCKPERTGSSIVHEMNAMSGGRMTREQFDIDDDNVIDDSDLITIPNPDYVSGGGEPEFITVAPTGIGLPGLIFPPKILLLDDSEIKYFSTSMKTIDTVREQTEKRGLYYWKEIH